MDYQAFGKTGLKVSKVGLGCAFPLKAKNKPSAWDDAKRLMDAAWEMGINYFDTANNYSGGESEKAIGAWLREKGGAARDQLIIGSKVRARVGDGPNDEGLSRHHILQQVEKSLKRLGVDHLDIYWTHGPTPNTPLDETLRGLDDLVHQGKVRYIGCSNMSAWYMMKALWTSCHYRLYPPVTLQNSYNLIEWGAQEEIFPMCQEQKLAFMAYSPMAGGFLSGKYKMEEPLPEHSRIHTWTKVHNIPLPRYWRKEVFDGVAQFVEEAKRRETSPAALSTAWVLNSPNVCSTLVGPRNVEQIEDVKKALEIKMSEQTREKLKSFFPVAYTYD